MHQSSGVFLGVKSTCLQSKAISSHLDLHTETIIPTELTYLAHGQISLVISSTCKLA